MRKAVSKDARLAGVAALVSAGAAAVSLARSPRRRQDEFSTDAALVGLIERVADATNRAASVDEALLACAEQVCRWTGWPIGHVYLIEDERAVPSRLWYIGDTDRFQRFVDLTDRTPLARGIGLPGRVVASGRAEWIVDVTCDANFPRRAEAARVGLRGGFSFPVMIGERCFAVIECFSLHAVMPNDRLLQVAAHVGRQLGRVIDGMQMAEALRQSESRLRSVAETANDAIIAADSEGLILSWNPGAQRMFGYDASEMIGRPLSLLMPERFRAMHDAGLRRVVERPESSRMIGKTFEVVGLRKDDAEFPIELSLATWETPEGCFFSGIIRDIGARRKAEDQARALESAPDPIVKVDAARRIVLVNARTEQLFGYARTELIGRSVEDLFDAHCASRVADRFHAALTGGEPTTGYGTELTGRRNDGTEFPVDVTLSRSDDADGDVVTSILRDVTERKRFESQLQHLADHDHVTALYNRRRFEQELSEYSAYAARYGRSGAVVLLDLDRFKYVNDTYGHSAGDDVVRMIGRALVEQVADTDVVARLGGDEFAILLKETDREGAERAAVAILDSIRSHTMPLDGLAVSITTSIGVALLGQDELVVDDRLAAADMAMYAAKDAGGDRYQVFDAEDERMTGVQARLAWADQIRRALDEDRFVLYWQPIIEIATGEAPHHELLLRMVGSDGEVIAPGAFIETAERFNLIQEIDRWVVGSAIQLLAAGGVPHPEHKLEVNLSAKSICDPQLPEFIERELEGTGVDPARLIFEITETAAIANMEQARAFAERLRRLGCRFALDDFGAGFSSFYYLKYFPLDYLKIDGDFIRSLTSSVTDQLVVKSMVDIARGMGMKTIAEFVENGETLAMLREHGVDYSQGYFHGRPQPAPVPAAAAL